MIQPFLGSTHPEVMGDQLLASLVQQLSQQHFAVIDQYLPLASVQHFKKLITAKKKSQALDKAGIGQLQNHQVNQEVRGDLISWIDESSEDAHTKLFMDYLRQIQVVLNRELFLGIKTVECHFTQYPAGTFYRRHIDQFNHKLHRVLSFVFYLNEAWKPGDGGELILYQQGEMKSVEPKAGRLVMFKSDIAHEVKTTHIERMSITGWMLDRPIGLTFL